MKAISLWQPWATAMVVGVKRNETRHWSTNHRGLVAIHAAKRRTAAERAAFEDVLSDSFESRAAFSQVLALDFDSLPFGALVGFGNLRDCVPTRGLDVTLLEDSWGNYEPGRFAWRFDIIWRLREPVFCVGRQGFFEVPVSADEIARAELVAGCWHFGTETPKQSENCHRDDAPDLYRIGKAAAGRKLDGKEHSGVSA